MTFFVILGTIVLGIFLAVLAGLVLLDMSPLGHSIAAAINWLTTAFVGDLVGGTFLVVFYILLVFFILGILVPIQRMVYELLLDSQKGRIIEIPIAIIASAIIPVLMYVFLDRSLITVVPATLMFLVSSFGLVWGTVSTRRIRKKERRQNKQGA